MKNFPGLSWYPWDESEELTTAEEIAPIAEKSFNQKEQLEAELREIKALLASPRSQFRPEAAEYAQRLGKALDRMAEEDRRMDRNCGNDKDEE
jgi:hypothetical protein